MSMSVGASSSALSYLQSLLQQGIECARRTRNQHALAEMEAMLDELERG